MPKFKYLTADVFTDVPFGGNQLAIFPDARGIPEHRLQDVTREFNFSETTFVYPPDDPSHTRRVRIFTPAAEIPFAGHPTVGTAHVLAAIGEIPLTGNVTKIVFEEKVGLVPVEIRAKDGVPVFAQLTTAMLPEQGPPCPDRATLAKVLGLDVADILDDAWAPQSFTTGLPFLFVPLVSIEAVARARLRLEPWGSAFEGAWAKDIFVFTMGGERPGSDVHARMFGPGVAVPEDPATGSACASLAGYLAPRSGQRDGTLRWMVEQGFEMGRPSMLEVETDVSGGRPTAVRVGGSTVLVCEGVMSIE
jgi:trans-2,3-dihydro-3-hydroxyanthranilate isomerase